MLLVRLPPSRAAARRVVIFAAFVVLVCSAASAQLASDVVNPSARGPSEPRPEVPDFADDSENLPLSGRSLPRIDIPESDTTASALSGGSISVREFRFRGNSVYTDEEINAVIRDYIGEGRRYSGMLEARDRVTRLYVDSGYISSGAILPDQDFADGIVKIEIIEGNLTEIEYETDGRLRERYFTSRLDPDRQTLNINELRERLRRLKRDSRVEAITAELLPGKEPGTSVLSIVVEEATPYWSAASFDNYVPEAIGGFRGYFRAGHRNLSGWGDSLSAAYRVAEGLHDLDVRIEAPITRLDTMIELSMRQGWTEIVEDDLTQALNNVKLENKTEAYGIRFEQPVYRGRGEEVHVFLAGEWKRGRTYLGGERGLGFVEDENRGKSTITVLRAGGDYLLRLQSRAIAARATAYVGLDILNATPGVKAFNTPNGKFVTGLIQIQEVEYLPWYEMRVQSRLDAQIADGSIPPLEQFALGGSASVRGFRENLAVRDQGVVGSMELRLPLPVIDPVESLEFGVFTDVGYGRYLDNASGKQATTLASIGFGVHADITPYIRTSIEWAFDLKEPSVKSGAVTGNELQDDGLHFSLQVRFP